MQRSSETLPSAFYGDKVLTNKYEPDTGTVPGRDQGFKLGTATDPDADMEVTYGYGRKGRLDEVTDTNGTYTYNRVADSNMIGTTAYPNGLTATKNYESDRNLVDYVQNDVNATTVSKYDYVNDAAGRRTDVVMTGTAFDSDTFNKYNYNTRSEVTGAQKYSGTDTSDTNNPVTSYDYDLDYDPIGNRETYTDAGNQTDYTANNLNQYSQISTLTDPQHDLDGNMTLMPSSSGAWNLTWNGENRLVTAENGTTKLEFTYDYKGRRIRKQVYEWDTDADLWSQTSDLRYVYDEWNLIEVLDATDSNAVVKTYTWGLDLSGNFQGAGGVGGLLSVTKHEAQGTTNAYYVSYDANGNASPEIVKMLLAHGAKINGRDEHGNTALMKASRAANIEILKVLLQKGASAGLTNEDGESAMLKADPLATEQIADVLKKYLGYAFDSCHLAEFTFRFNATIKLFAQRRIK